MYFQQNLGKLSISDFTKLVILLVILILIIALWLIEGNYKLFIKYASERARVLERSLNLKLTEKNF